MNDVAAAARRSERRLILRHAGELLASEGRAALTMRALAKRCGASTTLIYGHFSGKGELTEALYSEALASIGAHLNEEPLDADPFAALVQLALGYRAWAVAHPERYDVIARALDRNNADQLRSSAAYRAVCDAVQRAVDHDLLIEDDAEDVADGLWAYCHGMVMLELNGYFVSPRVAMERYAKNGMALLRGLRK